MSLYFEDLVPLLSSPSANHQYRYVRSVDIVTGTGHHKETNTGKEGAHMRRIGVLLLAAVIMSGTLIVAGGTFTTAQDATPAALTEHPLVGTWTLAIEGEEYPSTLDVFSADGTYVEASSIDGFGAGAWEATGENTANLTFRVIHVDGTAVIRATLEVAPDGQSLTATYTVETIAPDGTSSGELGPGTAEGTKVTVEPPGTPVGPLDGTFEDIFGEDVFGGESAATPTPAD